MPIGSMHPRHALFAILCSGSLSLAVMLAAADPVDPDLPQPLDLSVAAPLVESPPFTRPLDLSETLALTGVAYVDGKPVATLVDKVTKQNYLVSEVPNARGWRLAGANASTELKFTEVRIMVGPEVVTIHYGDAQLAPSSAVGTRPNRFPSDSEAIRTDENGKPYVRGSVYLTDAERERYYKSFSREAHDKFRDLVRNNREMMFKASPQERAAFAKKVFDQVEAEDKARQKR